MDAVFPPDFLKGRRALVTGGSSGIGEAIARSLLAAGARVAINFAHHPEQAREAAASLGPDVPAIQADLADPAAVAGMFAELDRAFGGIDVLVNNAGIDGKRALAWESEVADWTSVVELNLFGAYHCAREALRRMVPRKSGVIVNITSVHQEIAWSGYSAYTVSKAGAAMLTKTLAQEAAPFGIRVVSVAPGAIRTPINASVWQDPAGYRDLVKKIPLGRIGEPAEVGSVVAFLASDAASYVTGGAFFVDGGMTDFPDFAHGG